LFHTKYVSALILCHYQALIIIREGRTLKFCHTPYRDGILFGSKKNGYLYTKNNYKIHMCFSSHLKNPYYYCFTNIVLYLRKDKGKFKVHPRKGLKDPEGE